MAYPAQYKYTKTHEWVEDASDGTAKVGITEYAEHSLGDIVFVEMPKVGAKVEAGTIFGSVESVKAVSDLYSPVSGEVLEVNETLESAPETINTAANETWIFKLRMENASELATLDTLIPATAYEEFVKEETGH